MTKLRTALAVVTCLVAASAVLTTRAQDGAARTFDFKDPKGINAIGFFVNSDLEPIIGVGSGVSGTVSYDPAHPESFGGTIRVATDSLQTGHGKMNEHMHGDGWLKAGSNPTIDFVFEKVTAVDIADDGSAVLTVDGKLSLAGITLDKTVQIQATYHEGKAKARGGAKSGDLLKLQSMFTVSRADFGIKPDMDGTKVGTEVNVMVAIMGYAK